MSEHKHITKTPDALFRNYDEAREWVDTADLFKYPIVLEDWFDKNHIATARIMGYGGQYTVEITNHEGKDSVSETEVDATEVAEMMGGWTVVGRELGEK